MNPPPSLVASFATNRSPVVAPLLPFLPANVPFIATFHVTFSLYGEAEVPPMPTTSLVKSKRESLPSSVWSAETILFHSQEDRFDVGVAVDGNAETYPAYPAESMPSVQKNAVAQRTGDLIRETIMF